MAEMREFLTGSIGLRLGDHTIQDVLHVGYNVVLELEAGLVYKARRSKFIFGAQVGEFNLEFQTSNGGRAYDLGRLNAKLAALVGNRDYWRVVSAYKDVVDAAIEILRASNVGSDARRVLNAMGAPMLANIVRREMAIRNGTAESDLAFECTSGLLDRLVDALDPVGQGKRELYENPLLVWAGARLEGFFTAAEMSDVCRFLRRSYDLDDEMFAQCGAMAAAMIETRAPCAEEFGMFISRLITGNDALKFSEFDAFSDQIARCGVRISLFDVLLADDWPERRASAMMYDVCDGSRFGGVSRETD